MLGFHLYLNNKNSFVNINEFRKQRRKYPTEII